MRYRIILDPSSFRFHFRLKDQSEASENPSENYSYASNGTFIQGVSHNLDPLGVVEKTFPLAPSFLPFLPSQELISDFASDGIQTALM